MCPEPQPAGTPAVFARGVEYSYRSRKGGSHKALSGLDFRVAEGEIFGFLGPNGGGKTTLFRILATLARPEAGSIQVFGTDLASQAREVRRRLGVVFQNPSLDLHLTVRENLLHQGHLYGLRGGELARRIDAGLERFGLAERTSQRALELSGGLRRRVELAKALLHEPRLLLLDEPSTGLDPGARRDLWGTLEALRAQGVTVLLTTHFMEEGDRCDRLALLDRGALVAEGSPAALKEEIGGDVITLAGPDPEALSAAFSCPLSRACAELARWCGAAGAGTRARAGGAADRGATRPDRRRDRGPSDAGGRVPPPDRPSALWRAGGGGVSGLAAFTLWRRELVRFFRQPSRIAGAAGSPLIFWVLIGSGLSSSFRLPGGAADVSYLEYFFPGTLVLIVLFAAIFSTISVIEDRNQGFLQGVLVAPVSLAAIAGGKVLGGATLAWLQAVVFLALAPLSGIRLTLGSVLASAGVLAALGFALTGGRLRLRLAGRFGPGIPRGDEPPARADVAAVRGFLPPGRRARLAGGPDAAQSR